jgi:YHS domain-containing protein
MKKLMFLVAAVMLTGFLACGQAFKPSAVTKAVTEAKAQTVCPVMGGKIDKKCFVDVKGKRIYMCCPGCAEKIKADPDKYIKILEDQGEVIENAPEAKKEAPAVKK